MRVDRRRPWLAQAVLEDGFKYIEASDSQRQLFDLGNDPFELRNLIEVNEEMATHLQSRLASWRQLGLGEGAGSDRGATGLSERQREALRSLGYLR